MDDPAGLIEGRHRILHRETVYRCDIISAESWELGWEDSCRSAVGWCGHVGHLSQVIRPPEPSGTPTSWAPRSVPVKHSLLRSQTVPEILKTSFQLSVLSLSRELVEFKTNLTSHTWSSCFHVKYNKYHRFYIPCEMLFRCYQMCCHLCCFTCYRWKTSFHCANMWMWNDASHVQKILRPLKVHVFISIHVFMWNLMSFLIKRGLQFYQMCQYVNISHVKLNVSHESMTYKMMFHVS